MTCGLTNIELFCTWGIPEILPPTVKTRQCDLAVGLTPSTGAYDWYLRSHLLGEKHGGHAQAGAQHNVRHGDQRLAALHQTNALERKRRERGEAAAETHLEKEDEPRIKLVTCGNSGNDKPNHERAHNVGEKGRQRETRVSHTLERRKRDEVAEKRAKRSPSADGKTIKQRRHGRDLPNETSGIPPNAEAISTMRFGERARRGGLIPWQAA